MFKHVCAAFAALTLCVAGCDRSQEAKEDKSAKEPQAAPSATAADVPMWPDGWLMVSSEEWIPVLDEVGRQLYRARGSFAKGEIDQARQAVQAALKDVENKQAAERAADDKAALSQVASQLRDLDKRLENKGEVTLPQFDQALTTAYQNDVAVDWLYLKQETWAPTFERPAEHFQRALSLLDEGKNHEAGDEIRRGAGYFKLAARSARSDDRQLLTQQVTELAALAKRADAGTLKADVLRKALVDTDNAYAASYLHQAEDSWNKKESQQANRSLHEALARMRASARWLGDETQEETRKLLSELEQLGDKMQQGASIAADEVKSTFERARTRLQSGTEKRPSAG